MNTVQLSHDFRRRWKDRGLVAASFVNHIASDDLIGVGFVGQGGVGEDSPFATIASPRP